MRHPVLDPCMQHSVLHPCMRHSMLHLCMVENRLPFFLYLSEWAAQNCQGVCSMLRSSTAHADSACCCLCCCCWCCLQAGYNAEQNAAYWATRPVPVIARLIRIGGMFVCTWSSKHVCTVCCPCALPFASRREALQSTLNPEP